MAFLVLSLLLSMPLVTVRSAGSTLAHSFTASASRYCKDRTSSGVDVSQYQPEDLHMLIHAASST